MKLRYSSSVFTNSHNFKEFIHAFQCNQFSNISFLLENQVIPPCSLIVQDFYRRINHTYKTYFNFCRLEKAPQHNRHETTTAVQPQKLKVLK